MKEVNKSQAIHAPSAVKVSVLVIRERTKEIIDDSLSVSGPVNLVSEMSEKMSDNCTNGTICKANDDVICELVPVKEEPKRPTKAQIKCRKSYTLKEKLECLGKIPRNSEIESQRIF